MEKTPLGGQLAPDDLAQLEANVRDLFGHMGDRSTFKEALSWLLLRSLSVAALRSFSSLSGASRIPLPTLLRYASPKCRVDHRLNELLLQPYPRGIHRVIPADAATACAERFISDTCGFTHSGSQRPVYIRWGTWRELFGEYKAEAERLEWSQQLGFGRFKKVGQRMHVRRSKNNINDEYTCIACRALYEAQGTLALAEQFAHRNGDTEAVERYAHTRNV